MGVSGEFRSDILVIGGGLAGMMAALASQSMGKKVILVSQAPIGKSGNTLVAGGGISAATEDPGNDSEIYFTDVMKSGKGLNNPKLVKKLVEDSPCMIKKLEEYGVKLIRRDGVLRKRQPPGHSVARNIPTDWSGISYLNRGLAFSLPLLKKLEELDVQLISGVRIVQLIQRENLVVGAVGMDREGQTCRFSAGSVILATGGAGYLYGKTNNVKDIIGDGLAMALNAGCSLQDMEQIQFYPTMMFQPVKVTISNPLFGVGAVLRNADYERFMAKYHSAGDMATRDIMARSIFLETKAGRGINGSVYVDCTGIPAEQLKELYKDFYHFLTKAGVDPTKDYLKVSPCVHYSLGGIVIDELARTQVPGLYAAGEICGGIHGANRLSGAALMEDCVFGWQAGISAAVEKQEQRRGLDEECTILWQKPSAEIESEIKKLRYLMWDQVSLVRSEQSLKQAQQSIEDMAERLLQEGKASENIGFGNMLKVAKSIVISAMLRQESRGAHYRSDYPETDSEFDGNVHCRQENGQLVARLIKQ